MKRFKAEVIASIIIVGMLAPIFAGFFALDRSYKKHYDASVEEYKAYLDIEDYEMAARVMEIEISRDSNNTGAQVYYDNAMKLLAEQQKEEAYQRGLSYMTSKRWTRAIKEFVAIEPYKDSGDLIDSCMIQYAQAYNDTESMSDHFNNGLVAFQDFNDYITAAVEFGQCLEIESGKDFFDLSVARYAKQLQEEGNEYYEAVFNMDS